MPLAAQAARGKRVRLRAVAWVAMAAMAVQVALLTAAQFLVPTVFPYRTAILLTMVWRVATAEPAAGRDMARQATEMPVWVGKARMVMAGRYAHIKPALSSEALLTVR